MDCREEDLEVTVQLLELLVNIDTGISPDTSAAVYDVYVSVNPNTAGSSAYRDVIYGKLYYGTGWNGSAVTSYIYFVQESPGRMYQSGGSEPFVDCSFS